MRTILLLLALMMVVNGESADRRSLMRNLAVAASSEITTGMLAWWKLNDSSGSTGVDSIGTNTLTLIGSPTWNGSTNLAFNGTSQAGTAAIDLSGQTVITLTFWLNWTTFSGNDDLAFEFTTNSNNRAGFVIDPNSSSSGTPFETTVSAAGSLYNGGKITRPSASAWHFYAVVIDRTTGTAISVIHYVDGSVVTTTQSNSGNLGGGAFANSILCFMSRNGAELFGAGSLDDVRVYGRSLTSGEVSTLNANGAK